MRAALTLLVLFPSLLAPAAPKIVTLAEQSHWKRTGRYEEVPRLCGSLADAYPGQARCLSFGKTPEGRAMVAIVVGEQGVLDAKSAHARKRPVMLFQGGIHAGEIDGKDAGFLFLREILDGQVAKGALRKMTLVFVPVFNVDGHERFGKHNRPNQVGPEEMGWRTTAQNLNLNRDYVKADAPEMLAMLDLLREWDPLLYVDLHVTDGAQFQPDVSITALPAEGSPLPMEKVSVKLQKALLKKLAGEGHQPVGFYPDFEKDDDPSSGFSAGDPPPRFSNSYWQWHNRIGVLVEAHSWKDYATRVRATHDSLVGLAELLAAEGTAWLRQASKADREGARLAGKEVALLLHATTRSRTIEFPGYAYKRESSPISGGTKIVYDPTHPEIWKVPFFGELKPVVAVRAPREGYLVPAAYAAWVGEKLRHHGVGFEVLGDPPQGKDVRVFRAQEVTPEKQTFEGHLRVAVKGEWKPERREIPAGSLFVPIAQPLGGLAMQIFEPSAPDSLLAWGFFNTAFERKEYMENYLAEEVAMEMLARDPKLKAEFAKKVAEDPEFAKDPQRRLEFFYRRHPSWDERFRLYPVYRVENR